MTENPTLLSPKSVILATPSPSNRMLAGCTGGNTGRGVSRQAVHMGCWEGPGGQAG